MKKYFSFVVSLLLLVILVAGLGTLSSCKKKVGTPIVTEWETYQDPVYGFEIQHPKGWLRNTDPKSMRIYSSQTVSDKFYEVYSQGSTSINSEEGGVEIMLTSEKFSDAKVGTLEEYKASTLKNFEALKLTGETPITMAKETGVEYSFKVKVGKETVLQGKKIVVAHDSSFYILSISGFNEYFDAYKPIFDQVIASLKLPKPKESYKDPNAASKPKPEVSKFSNDFVEFMYPENFDAQPAKEKKGGSVFAMKIQGLRQDCTVDIDIFPTKTDKGVVKYEKFVDENKSKFNPKSTSTAKVDGQDAIVLTASPSKDIDRKVYFVTKGEKIYRVILTWYKPMGADFQPAFENVVTSLKLK
jgi:hypothetical protein